MSLLNLLMLLSWRSCCFGHICVLVSHLDLTVSIMTHLSPVAVLQLLLVDLHGLLLHLARLLSELRVLLHYDLPLHGETCLHVLLLWLRHCLYLSLLLNLLRGERVLGSTHCILPILLRGGVTIAELLSVLVMLGLGKLTVHIPLRRCDPSQCRLLLLLLLLPDGCHFLHVLLMLVDELLLYDQTYLLNSDPWVILQQHLLLVGNPLLLLET